MSTWSPRCRTDPELRKRYVGSPRHLAILRTSRQIYIEASYTLHSELTVRIKPRDIIVGKSPQTFWRHDPFYGRGAVDKNGKYVYNSPELDGGLEPHVFARLRRIHYDALLRFPMAPIVSLKEDLSMEPQFQRYYTRYICETNVPHIQRFVTSIFHSPIIDHLSIDFGVDSVRFLFPKGVFAPKGVFGKRMVEEMQIAANRQARDILVHCGVLAPLRALHNVRSFNLGFFKEESAEGFPVWLAELVRDIKLTVERNFWTE